MCTHRCFFSLALSLSQEKRSIIIKGGVAAICNACGNQAGTDVGEWDGEHKVPTVSGNFGERELQVSLPCCDVSLVLPDLSVPCGMSPFSKNAQISNLEIKHVKGHQQVSWDLALQPEVTSESFRCFIVIMYKPQWRFLSAHPTLPCPASPHATLCFLLPHLNSTPLVKPAFSPLTSPPFPCNVYPVILKTQNTPFLCVPINANVLLPAYIISTCYLPPTHNFCMHSHEVR